MISANYFVNAIRSMGLQAIKKAKQGHPGMAISAAPITYAVYIDHINIATDNPEWINRDRFVLSAGHGSMSLYPILHFSRLIELDKIENFRQTIFGMSGHPENISSPYIEASTGPLGQGLANGVGMAIAEAYLENQYSELEGLINHYTFVVVGDGDLQEGISYESMSLAGKLELKKLIVLHDSNNFQLETSVNTVNIENIKNRVESMNWNYYTCNSDPYAINKIIRKIKSDKNNTKPSFIEIKSIIGEGLSFQNSFNAHGGAITDDEIENFNKHFECNFNNWNFDSNIYYHFFKNIVQKGNYEYQEWKKLLDKYQQEYPELTNEFLKQVNNDFVDLKECINVNDLPKNKSTRVVAGWIMEQLDKHDVKDLLVLSPDVSKSTNITMGNSFFNNDKTSNMLMVGIREFAMMAIQNGIQLHGGLRTISSSFLAFSDYLKSALRLAAISEISPVIAFTHDSVAVGADGPTHQPIEQVGTLRSIPNTNTWRPCDEKETLAAFIESFNKNNSKKPTSIVLSRQNLTSLENSNIQAAIEFGGYEIFRNTNDIPSFTLCASGSEVSLAIETANFLKENFNLTSSVFSVPNLNKFVEQNGLCKKLKSQFGLVTIEASNDSNWYKLSEHANNYCNVGIEHFGYSIDGTHNYEYLGMNPVYISKKIIDKLIDNDPSIHQKMDELYQSKKQQFQFLIKGNN